MVIPVESWIVHFGWFGSEHVCGGFAEASEVKASAARHVSRAAAAVSRVLMIRPFLGRRRLYLAAFRVPLSGFASRIRPAGAGDGDRDGRHHRCKEDLPRVGAAVHGSVVVAP
jgi:hypothetical protein